MWSVYRTGWMLFGYCPINKNYSQKKSFNFSQEPYSDLLRVLTLVLCSLSACCLALSLLYFAGHRGNDRSDRVRINSHFCLNLLAVQVN